VFTPYGWDLCPGILHRRSLDSESRYTFLNTSHELVRDATLCEQDQAPGFLLGSLVGYVSVQSSDRQTSKSTANHDIHKITPRYP